MYDPSERLFHVNSFTYPVEEERWLVSGHFDCNNDQGYGYMIPVKTSKGWDFIDTYQLDYPWKEDGESEEEASVRQIIELGISEHDGYVDRKTSPFYHHNIHLGRTEVPFGLQLLLNLNDYDIMPRRKSEDYSGCDVVYNVPLYREQNFSWNFGKALGLCFVKKESKKNLVKEFLNLLTNASSSITRPYAGESTFYLNKAKEKLTELESLGLATQKDKDAVQRLSKRVEVINKCVEDLREINMKYLAKLKDMENE